jgi:Polyketide cyclase / dehydrase and lipid transport
MTTLAIALVMLTSTAATVATSPTDSATAFQHTLETPHAPETIWRCWVNVGTWKTWDTGLRDASLRDSFAQGARGTVIPDKGPKAKFKIASYREGQAYSLKFGLPGSTMLLTRTLQALPNGGTRFTHRVEFTGMLRKFWAKKLGSRYRTMLPEAMQKLLGTLAPAQ